MAKLRIFIERYWQRTAAVCGLLVLDFLVFVVVCTDSSYDGRTYGIPTSLRHFTERWYSGGGVNFLPLGLASSHISLLTLWVLFGRSLPEVRWGALLFTIAACVASLSLYYGQDCPAPAANVLFVAQTVGLLVCIPLLRIHLFPPNRTPEAGRRQVQFSIRTLLLITTLVAIGLTVLPQIDLGILIDDPSPFPSARKPLGTLTWPSSLNFLTTGGGPKVICVWKLLLGLCSTLSVLLSIVVIRGSPWKIPHRLLVASAISTFAVGTIIWFTVDHQRWGQRFFYPPINWIYTQNYGPSAYYELFFPWIGWILVQLAVVSSVLLAFRWNGLERIGSDSTSTAS